jgi:hypothetical protein
MTNEKLNSADKFRFVFQKILDIFTLIFVLPRNEHKNTGFTEDNRYFGQFLILETFSYFKLEQKNSTFNDFLYYLF